MNQRFAQAAFLHDVPAIVVELLADRFLMLDATFGMDLATGDRVLLTLMSPGAARDELRWNMRCDALRRLRHPALAELVDFGALGRGARFEAWRCGPSWRGDPAAADAAARSAAGFLRACGLTAGGVVRHLSTRAPWGEARERERAVVLPDAGAGCPIEAAATAVDLAGRDSGETDFEGASLGLSLRVRPVISTLAGLFEETPSRRPRIAAMWGPRGAGRSNVCVELARTARLRGFVPLATRLVGRPAVTEAVNGRSVFLIHDPGQRAHPERRTGSPDPDAWAALVEATMLSPRPHILLFASDVELPGVDGIALDRIEAGDLRGLIRPLHASPVLTCRIRRAAAAADGRPGRFVERLWPGWAYAQEREPVVSGLSGLRAAEQPATYGEQPPIDEAVGVIAGRLDNARRQLGAGRQAAGEREVRRAIGALTRRGEWARAGEGALVLASSLLRRGQARQAQDLLEQAIRDGRLEGEPVFMLRAATLAGHGWIDLGRLDEAEAVLGAALTASRRTTAAGTLMALPTTVLGSLALARCLFWRGRYADADSQIAAARRASRDTRNEPPPAAEPAGLAIRAAALEARIAVGMRELDRAMALIHESTRAATAAGDASLSACAAYAAAFVRLAAGDLEGVEREAGCCVRAARLAREPLLAMRARLLMAESCRRVGRRSLASAVVKRLNRMASQAVPAIVGARIALLSDLVTAPDAGSRTALDLVRRHAVRTGLDALVLFVPRAGAIAIGWAEPDRPDRHDRQPQEDHAVCLRGEPSAPATLRAPRPDPVLVDDVLDILARCQDAEDEPAMLADVCVKLARRLRAPTVAFVARDGQVVTTIAAHGRRAGSAAAVRAMDAGLAIEPGRTGDGIESAVPVRYGGAVIGSLTARWGLGTTDDLAGATALLTIAATAAAPILSAARAHRERERRAPEAAEEIAGSSTAMCEVRRGVERAARAPFSVLIEGESGVGKELVARALHHRGPRRDRPFSTVNCAALPEDLIEAELFGHARGAFTGAIAERPGVFEEAHGGTLFLDEIGELSPRAQAKILRVLQEGELRRVGENMPRRVDVRVVSATNRDLRAEAVGGRFRHDLLYRLDVIHIVVPPLRERRDDIAPLVEMFWREATARLGSRAQLGAATVAALVRYNWPGNVRELQNVLAALAVRCSSRGLVSPAALPPHFDQGEPSRSWRLDEARRTFEAQFVRAALARTGGRRTRAAMELGVTRQGLNRLMARLGITVSHAPGQADERPAPE